MALLDTSTCGSRRERLIARLAAMDLDAAVITDARDVYYLTGRLFPTELPLALLLTAEGETSLVGPAEQNPPAVDHFAEYGWNIAGTKHPDISRSFLRTVTDTWRVSPRSRIGVQEQSLTASLARVLDDLLATERVPFDAALADMQSRKDPDEVVAIRASVAANQGAYASVCNAIREGATELEVLAAGQRGAMLEAGKKCFHDGDYRCGAFNGPARDRPIEAGELYIVDAWTCLDGYWSDMSRAYVVGAAPSDAQQALYDHLLFVHNEVATLLKPGVDGRDVFVALDELLRQHPPLTDSGLVHHGGHAIGLRNHEMPDINRDRGGVLEPGAVVCVEPGGYFPEARYGVRLENMYLITEDGCEDLCEPPGGLTVCQG